MHSPIRVLIIESQTPIRIGIKTILQAQKDIEIFAEAETGDEGFEIFKHTHIDVVLMSLRLGESCAIDEIGDFCKLRRVQKSLSLLHTQATRKFRAVSKAERSVTFARMFRKRIC